MFVEQLDISLDQAPGATVEHEWYLQEVEAAKQPGFYWCWAACFASATMAKRRLKGKEKGKAYDPEHKEGRDRATLQGKIVFAEKDCSPEGCALNKASHDCDQPLGGGAMEDLWRQEFAIACRVEGPLEPAELKKEIKNVGPVQVELDKWHVVLVDGWQILPNMTVQVRVMDPGLGSHDWFNADAHRERVTATLFRLSLSSPEGGP